MIKGISVNADISFIMIFVPGSFLRRYLYNYNGRLSEGSTLRRPRHRIYFKTKLYFLTYIVSYQIHDINTAYIVKWNPTSDPKTA